MTTAEQLALHMRSRAAERPTDRAAAASRSPNFLVTLRASFTPDCREGTERAEERFSRRRMFGYRLRNVWKFLENSFQKCMECRAKDVNDERAANRRDWRLRARMCFVGWEAATAAANYVALLHRSIDRGNCKSK